MGLGEDFFFDVVVEAVGHDTAEPSARVFEPTQEMAIFVARRITGLLPPVPRRDSNQTQFVPIWGLKIAENAISVARIEAFGRRELNKHTVSATVFADFLDEGYVTFVCRGFHTR